MITARIFHVLRDNVVIDRIYFVGEEYNSETVKQFLIERGSYGGDKDIKIKQIKEIRK